MCAYLNTLHRALIEHTLRRIPSPVYTFLYAWNFFEVKWQYFAAVLFFFCMFFDHSMSLYFVRRRKLRIYHESQNKLYSIKFDDDLVSVFAVFRSFVLCVEHLMVGLSFVEKQKVHCVLCCCCLKSIHR